jgi:hypothetical protein
MKCILLYTITNAHQPQKIRSHQKLKIPKYCIKNLPYLSKITKNLFQSYAHSRGWIGRGREGGIFHVQKVRKLRYTRLYTRIVFAHPNSFSLTGIVSKLSLCCNHCGVMIRSRHGRGHGDELSARMMKLHPTRTHSNRWVWPTYVVR